MILLPHEEIINIPLSKLTLTNRRIRFSPHEQAIQSMSLKEVSSINLVSDENKTYFILFMLGLLIAGVGILLIARNEGFGNLAILIGAILALAFFFLHRSSKTSVLSIESTGGIRMTISLKKKEMSSAKSALQTIENAKLALE